MAIVPRDHDRPKPRQRRQLFSPHPAIVHQAGDKDNQWGHGCTRTGDFVIRLLSRSARAKQVKPSGSGPIADNGKNTYSWSTGHTRSEEHTSELQSLMRISYAVFCLKKKTKITK